MLQMFQCREILFGAISGIVILNVFANSETYSDAGSWEIVCKLDFPDVFCATNNKQLPDTEIATIPLNSIPEPEKVETISIDLRRSREVLGRCLINDHTMFHRFTNVFDIEFIGNVSISPLYQTEEREKLINELFNLPKLEKVRLENWKQGDSYPWKFPNNISNLELIGQGYNKFDLSSYLNVHILRLSENNLSTIPKLSTPFPPLRILDLFDNPDLKITAYDIVGLCELRVLHASEVNARTNEMHTQCECIRLKKYMKTYRIDGSQDFQCSWQKDCNGYDLDKLRSIREACSRGNKIGFFCDRDCSDEIKTSSQLFWMLFVVCTLAIYSAVITVFFVYDLMAN